MYFVVNAPITQMTHMATFVCNQDGRVVNEIKRDQGKRRNGQGEERFTRIRRGAAGQRVHPSIEAFRLVHRLDNASKWTVIAHFVVSHGATVPSR